MTKKQIITIFAMCILMALCIPTVSAEPCSFCEFINISNITRGVTDHSLLTNLSADDHLQYILTDGSRDFTGRQSLGGFNITNLLDPVAPQDAATKNYVDLVNASMQAYVDANPPVTDHGLLSNLSGDGHPQYILTAGTRAFTGMQSLGGFNLTDLLDPVALQDAATKNYVDLVNTSMQAYVDAHPPVTDHGLLSNLSGDGHPQYILTAGTRAFTGKQSLGGFNLTDLLDPVAPQDAATKSYVDAIPIYNASYWTGTNYNASYLTSTYNATYDAKPDSTYNATYDSKPSSTYNATYDAQTNYNASYWTGTNYNASYITSTYNATYDGNPTQTTRVFSEFYDPSTNAIPGFLGVAISSGTVGAVATTANHPGVIYMRDSTTGAGGYRYGCAGTGTQLIAGGETFEVVFQPVGVRAAQRAQLGWSDAAAANTLPVDGIFFNISGSGAAIVLRGNTSANSVRSGTATTYTPTTATWYRGTIVVNSDGTLVTYTIYNEAGASQWTDTVATNIPTGAGRDTIPCIIVAEGTTDAAADILRLDYVNWGSTRTLVR
jgi:hypothetical protein